MGQSIGFEAVEHTQRASYSSVPPTCQCEQMAKWRHRNRAVSPVWIWHLGTMLLLQSLSDFRWHRIREMGGRSRASLATMPLALLARLYFGGEWENWSFPELSTTPSYANTVYALDWIKPCTFYLFELDRKRCIKF